MANETGELNAPAETASSRELMDAIYRHQRHVYDVTRKYYLLGRDRLVERLDAPAGGTVLELGCGTGRNLILAARRYPHARFYGIDLSAGMLATAKASVERAGLSGRIALGYGDAARFDPQEQFGLPGFDRVFISYSLSMIPPWREALAAGLAATRPGGSLHVVDFGQQDGLPRWFRKLLRAWLARFHVEPRAELEAAMRGAAATVEGEVAFASLYRDYARAGEITRPPATAGG